MQNSKSTKPTSRQDASLRRVPKSNSSRRVIKATDIPNTKGFQEWVRTGEVNLDLIPDIPKKGSVPPDGLRKAAQKRMKNASKRYR